METKFTLFEDVYLEGDKVKYYRGLKLEFESLNECFNYLEKIGRPVDPNDFCAADPQHTVRKAEKNIVVYASKSTSSEDEFLINPEVGASCYYIEQNHSCSENLPYDDFLKAHADWERAKIARKFFHPGNSLTLAFILTAIGIGLIGFGVACPPALVFVALGVAVFSAVSAIGYAIDWLKRDWSAYEAISNADEDVDNPSLRGYLEVYWQRLKGWIPNHKPQAIMMGIGAVVFLGALAVVAGHFIAIAVTGAGFAFMTMGASGGVLGLTSSFFAAGFGAISGLTSSVAAVLTAAFTATALVLGPTNILDSIRRAVSGIYKKITEDELPHDNPNEPPAKPDTATGGTSQINLSFGSKPSFSFGKHDIRADKSLTDDTDPYVGPGDVANL